MLAYRIANCTDLEEVLDCLKRIRPGQDNKGKSRPIDMNLQTDRAYVRIKIKRAVTKCRKDNMPISAFAQYVVMRPTSGV